MLWAVLLRTVGSTVGSTVVLGGMRVGVSVKVQPESRITSRWGPRDLALFSRGNWL